MRNTFLYNSKSSSISKELVNKTISKGINWVSCERFIEHLEIQGIAFDDITWFHSYLLHIQEVRHYPSYPETYFTIYDDRIFAISKSKIFRELRMDFASILDKRYIWRGIIDSQASLSRLHSLVEITDSEDSADQCQELLYSTGCIHA